MSRDELAQVPASSPDPAHVPQDEECLAPVGRLRGDAAEVLSKIAQARLAPSAKDLLLVLFQATYAPSNATGWVRFTFRGLADYFHTWPNDIAERLTELARRHVIHKARSHRTVVCLRPVADWDPDLFDFEAARARHARPGAGAPPIVREPASHIPLAERMSDIRDHDFTEREVVEAHVRERGGNEQVVAAHWAVVERFQSIFDQRFPPRYFDQLTAIIAKHSTTSIIAEMTRIKNVNKPNKPWGYLRTTLENMQPRQREAGNDHRFSTPRQDARQAAERRRGAGVGAARPGADSADGGADTTGTGTDTRRVIDLDTDGAEVAIEYILGKRNPERV